MVMETMERERDGPPDRQLYALLHLSPEASDDDVKKAYRQWAQVYHPDKHQTPQMQDIATQNFQKIREAYEILSDERKRQIYDLYGMEGLTSGLELGPKLKSREEVRAEFERLQQRQEERRLAAHVHHRGSLLMNLSLVPFLESYEAPRMNGMAMSTQVQAQVSKRDTVVLGGNMALRRGLGGGSVTMVLRRQISPISSVEVLAMVGLRSILSLQTSRQLSTHSTGTLGLSLSLRDGSVTLANTWSRQLSEDTTGNIQLVIGPDTGISVGWQRHGKKNAGSADVKVGPATFGVSGQYIRHFSSKSQGRLTGKFGSTGVELELGGERRLSEHSSAAMFCVLGLQGVSWKVRFTRGGQKFVIPIVLCTTLNPFIATGALILPSSIYAILKTFVFKPYNLRRNRRKSLELRRSTYAQVVEARASSERSQLLLKNVAERKKQKQAQRQGLVILAAVYGDIKAYERGTNLVDKSASTEDDDVDLPPPYLDVAIPVQFLVDDFGQLRLHEGVKKAGLMGFCDPCPGESKQLKVSYSYLGNQYEVVVGDYDELRIPQEAHRIRRSTSEKLDQVFVNRSCSVDFHGPPSEPSPRCDGEVPPESSNNCTNQFNERVLETTKVIIGSVKYDEVQQTEGGDSKWESKHVKDSCKGQNLLVTIDVQDVASFEEMHEIILELVDLIVGQQEDNMPDMKSMSKHTQGLLNLTYEDLAMMFLMEGFSSSKHALVEVADLYNVMKGVNLSSMPQNIGKWLNEAQRIGLGWTPIDDNKIGFRVDSVQAWLVALILIYEAQHNVKLFNTVDFKFAVDARKIDDQQRIICEVMLELLCYPSPLSCISIAKWEGEDQHWDEIFSHMVEISDPKNIFCQLVAICEDGLYIEDRHLDVSLIECHHMAYYCSNPSNGKIKAFTEQFCPWCTIPRQARCMVTMNHNVSEDDTVALLSSTYHMRPQLLVELNNCLDDLHPEDKIVEFLPNVKSVVVFQHWPMNRNNMYKLTTETTLSSVYCACHALTRTIARMVRTLGLQAQQYDQISNKEQSRFTKLWQVMRSQPLLIECEITSFQCTNYQEIKYDEYDMEVASHILENHEVLLEVMNDVPTLESFRYTKCMWSVYRSFNHMQQLSHIQSPILYNQSLAVVAREFLYYATKALGEDITPYIHIQGAHAYQFQSSLPYSIGRLKNQAIQRKYKALNSKTLKAYHSHGRPTTCIKQDKLRLSVEMVAQYVRLKMEALPILQVLKKEVECWIPWSARSFYHRHFIQIGGVAISIDKAKELAEMFPPTTAKQVYHLFDTWSKNDKKESMQKASLFSRRMHSQKPRVVKDLATILKIEPQGYSYASLRCQKRTFSYINQYNLEMEKKHNMLTEHLLVNKELLQAYNASVLHNLCVMQMDDEFSNKVIQNEDNLHNDDRSKLVENANNIEEKSNSLYDNFVNDIYQNVKSENNKKLQIPQNSSMFESIESTSYIENYKKDNQNQIFYSDNIDMTTNSNNFKFLKIDHSKAFYEDNKILNLTKTKSHFHGDKILEEVLTCNMITRTNRDVLSSTIDYDKSESNSPKILPNVVLEELFLKESNITKPQDSLNEISNVCLQEKDSSNMSIKTPHINENKDEETKENDTITNFEGSMRQSDESNEDATKQDIKYDNNKLEFNNSDSNFTKLQYTLIDNQPSNIPDDNPNAIENCESNASKILDIDLSTIFVANSKSIDIECSKDVYTSNTSSKVLSSETFEIINNVHNDQPKICDIEDAYKLLSSNEQCEQSTSNIEPMVIHPLPSSSIRQEEILYEDLSLSKESAKNTIGDDLHSFRSFLYINDNQDNNKSVSSTNNAKKKSKHNSTKSEIESSQSQSYSVTPEDRGILKNTRHRSDDVHRNEKSSKLISFEKSLDSLSKKSRAYKTLCTRKANDDHKSSKTSNLQMPLWSASTKQDVKEYPPKLSTLHPSNSNIHSKHDPIKKKIKTLYPCNPYPPKDEELSKHKLNGKPKKSEIKEVDSSIQNKLEHHSSQSLSNMKTQNTSSSSPKQNSYPNMMRVCNNKYVVRNAKSDTTQYSKKHQFIEDDKKFFHSNKRQFQNIEHEDIRNDIFMPFLFDDANFIIPSESCDFQISSSFCPNEQIKTLSNSGKTVLITPDTCMISRSSLGREQIREPITNTQDFPIIIPSTRKHKNIVKTNESTIHSFVEIEIPHMLKDSLKQRVQNYSSSYINASKEITKTFESFEDEKDEELEALENEHINVNEYNSKEMEQYTSPCSCDLSIGHLTTCDYYTQNSKPHDVTRMRRKIVSKNPKVCVTCGGECNQQYMASHETQSKTLNHCEQKTNATQKAHSYCASQSQFCRDLDEGDVNVEPCLSARINSSICVEKYCEYDRIGRYRRVEIMRPHSRQKWKRI